MPNSSIQYAPVNKLTRVSIAIWLFITGFPVILLAMIPLHFLLFIFVSLIFSSAAVVPSILVFTAIGVLCAVYGIFKRWYISWLAARISFQLAPFLFGLAIVIGVFNFPFNAVGFGAIILLFILVKVSLLLLSKVNSVSLRESFRVMSYTHIAHSSGKNT